MPLNVIDLVASKVEAVAAEPVVLSVGFLNNAILLKSLPVLKSPEPSACVKFTFNITKKPPNSVTISFACPSGGEIIKSISEPDTFPKSLALMLALPLEPSPRISTPV